ncbi:MAG: hypothetical protein H7A25_22440 [Leptospiraceae bacterium]|nr:hypothetical protein [Leptospiraceae bacterium]MCP5502674.1 hypothetical protein [Leptospiraceae bacterium]
MKIDYKPIKEYKNYNYKKTYRHSNKSKSEYKKNFIILFLVFLIGSILIITISQLKNPDKLEVEKLELSNLEAKMEERVPLEKWEKDRFCELLEKVKGIKLFACNENYFCQIGSLTGYEIQAGDIDLRGTGVPFVEALKLAFEKTGVPVESFQAKEWAKDINGKTGIVRWQGSGGAEVNIDAPHVFNGPDVFHIGYQTSGKGGKRVRGHIFMDCVPYFRAIK